MARKSSLPILITILIVTICGSLYFYLKITYPFLFTKIQATISSLPSSFTAKLDPSPSSSPLPTRSPYPLIPDKGTAGTFNITQSHKTGPIFTNATIDPFDAKANDLITLTLTLKSDNPIKSLTGKVATDRPTKFLPIKFTHIKRVDKIETWSGQYTITSPVLYNYILKFEVTDGTNPIQYELPLRTN